MILKKAEISSSLGYNSLMKIGIIGQGAGGIFTAIALKKENPLLDIYLMNMAINSKNIISLLYVLVISGLNILTATFSPVTSTAL